MPRSLLRLVALLASAATLLWILTHDHPHGEVVTRFERQAPFQVAFEVRRGAPGVEGSGVLDRTLEVRFEGADGVVVLEGTLEFTRQGFRRSWEMNDAIELRLPPSAGCLVATPLPGRATRVRLTAQEFAPLTLELDPAAPNGGLPAQVVLLPAE